MFSTHPLDQMLMDTAMLRCPRVAHRQQHPRLQERDGDYMLSLSAPGVSAREVVLHVVGGTFKLEVESTTSRLSWSTQLPRDADAHAATATHVDGLLTVTFPKKELNGEHPGVECDKSGQNPILGKRYHLRGHDYDCCKAEFDKLGEREKALYDVILPPPKRVRLDVPVSDTSPIEEEEDDADEEEEGSCEQAKKSYKLTVPAAGIAAADLQVTIEGIEYERTLAVAGHSQRTGRRLHRQLYSLPRDADAERASAVSVDGLLTVLVPKQPPTVIRVMDAHELAADKMITADDGAADEVSERAAALEEAAKGKAEEEADAEADAVVV